LQGSVPVAESSDSDSFAEVYAADYGGSTDVEPVLALHKSWYFGAGAESSLIRPNNKCPTIVGILELKAQSTQLHMSVQTSDKTRIQSRVI
jgi:hypothetical protein